MTAIEILRAASRSVPNEDYVRFMAAVDAVAELIEALRKAEDRLGVLIESDNEDHGGAAPEDVVAWEACRAAIARVSGGGK